MAPISSRAGWAEQFDYLIPPRARVGSTPRGISELYDSALIESEDYRNIDRQVQGIRYLSIAERERFRSEPLIFRSEWTDGRPIPGFVLSAKYSGSDAFGASRMLANLDIAARRAAFMSESNLSLSSYDFRRGKLPSERTSTAGLYILDADRGSFDVVCTVWGSLAAIATSQPVAVYAMMSLAWDTSTSVSRLASRWRARQISSMPVEIPTISDDDRSPSGAGSLDSILPVLMSAVDSGSGCEIVSQNNGVDWKVTIPPRR